jgi:serine/threonine protein kinase
MNPTELGRFVIVKEIGKGAMGQVFLADDPKIDRKVAIKTVVMPQGTSPEDAQETGQRFVREAQAAGKLLHPNIVTIFDVGEEEGVSFIAMEYIEGEALDRYARADALLPLGTVLDIVSQTAAALDYAHTHNVVHRDIKPANLMVLPDGTIKVTDFGLAKNPQANLTQSGVLLGTPSYMSPEQIQGTELDGRSDLFSLGVMLYELLTGVRPFEAESISTIIYRILYEDPRPPAAHNPALPPDVNLVLEKALAKSPERRYATGSALAADLRKAFATLPPESLARPLAGVQPGFAAAAATSSRPTGPTLRNEKDRRKPITPPGARRPATDPRVGKSSMPGGGGTQPAPTLIAHHPVKLTALFLTLALALVLFPRWVNQDEPLRSGERERPRLPGGLDSIPLAEPLVVLSLADMQPHDIAARAGCMHAVAEMTAEDLASFSGPLVMELHPRREPVRIASTPIGARIRAPASG